jgi:hypothetical protein
LPPADATPRRVGLPRRLVAILPSGKRSLDLVEMLASVRRTQRVEGAVGIGRPETVDRQGGYARVGLFRDLEGQPGGLARWDRVDQLTTGVVDPVDVLGLGVR